VNNQITSGATGSGLNLAGLNGSQNLIKWGNGVLWVGGNNTSFTGNVSIEQGSLGITNANALTSAGTITAKRYGVIDILTTGFANTVTYEAGSIERWSVDNARSGTITIGAGSLQVNADQNTTVATVQLNGGAIEAFLRTDDVSSVNTGTVFRTLGSGVSISLLGNSFIGQNYFTDGPNGTDNGRTGENIGTGSGGDVNNSSELTSTARGAILEIKGNITGAGGLTKQSTDTVILSGSNDYTGSTNIANGTLRLGSSTAMNGYGDLTTTGRGVLDLGGYNASVKNLSTAAATASGTVFSSSSGFITNSATVTNTLTVNPTAPSTYGGVIQNNVAVTKAGSSDFTLTNANTYLGKTQIDAGALKLTGTATIADSPWLEIKGGANFDVSGRTGSTYTYDGVVSGGGVGILQTDNTNRATITGSLVVGDSEGAVKLIGSMAPGNSSLNTQATAGDQIGQINVTAGLTLLAATTGTTRLSLQLNGATSTLSTMGYAGTSLADMQTFIDNLPTTNLATINGLAGNLSGHDYVNVGGQFAVNTLGRIVISNFGSFTPNTGDVFNLLDWVSAVGFGSFGAGFYEGVRLQTGSESLAAQDFDLPTLTGGAMWDTSLFASHGVIVVVPEPGRMLLLMLGLMALFFRRRRRQD
jgi:autotransporter-associated beta strand protein